MTIKSLNILDKLNLKFVNKYFHAFIPPYSHADYLKAENLEGAKGKFYACHICCRLRPRGKFADNARIQTKGPGASKAKDRFCIECGLKPDATGYTRLCRNTWIIINKVLWVVCYQCGNLGKAHNGDGTNWCEDCWRLDVQPRLETHANPGLSDPVQVAEQGRLGETWISNYTNPHDVVQSAILVGISTPNAFAKHKNSESNGEEAVVSENFHAREEDMVFKKKSKPPHPKLISGKKSKREYRERYRPPFMTRSEARKERAATELKAVADNGLAMDLDTPASTNGLAKDVDSNGGPGPSTLANASKKAHLAGKADTTMETDTPAAESVPQQKGDPSPALLMAGISTTQEGRSQQSSPKRTANVPVWAQNATSQTNSQPLNLEAPTFIPMSAVQVKSSRHPEAKGPVHIPIWARATPIQEGLPQRLGPEATPPVTMHAQKTTTQVSAQPIDSKGPQNLSASAQNAATIGASTTNTISAKDQRVFAQPRYTIYDDMDLKPPCALKIALKARSYSKKPAAPIECKARGNSGNIIAMNYLKARQALHQRDAKSQLGWHSSSTVDLDTEAEVNSVSRTILASYRVESEISRKHRASDDRLFVLHLRIGRSTTDKDDKERGMDEDSEEEFKSFSDGSTSSSPKSASEAALEELRAKAVSRNLCPNFLVATSLIVKRHWDSVEHPNLFLSAAVCFKVAIADSESIKQTAGNCEIQQPQEAQSLQRSRRPWLKERFCPLPQPSSREQPEEGSSGRQF
ncbi:MAG: hypothetical protein Q9195_000801 [Heterodermia aff. obscurata]